METLEGIGVQTLEELEVFFVNDESKVRKSLPHPRGTRRGRPHPLRDGMSILVYKIRQLFRLRQGLSNF